MDGKEIILKYLKEKSNEEEVIALLQEQKRLLTNKKDNSSLLNNEYFSLMLQLAKSSNNKKIKYHAMIILSNVEFFLEPMNFYELCQIAADSSIDKDGNIRQACFILIKNLNAWMLTLPLINKLQNANKTEVNLFYESFRGLFYKLYFWFYNSNEDEVKKSVLKSLGVMLPKFQDMAKFWKDQEEIEMANKIKEELNKV